MAERKRVGGLNLDPAVVEWRKQAAENRAALSGKQRRDRRRNRASYDLSPAVQAIVSQIAAREDTSASQIVEMFLAYGIQAYYGRETVLRTALDVKVPARTPRFSWNLKTPQRWLDAAQDS